MAFRRILSQIVQEWRDLRGTTARDTQLRRDTAQLFLLTSQRRDARAFSRRLTGNEVALDDLPSFEEQAERLRHDLILGTVSILRAIKTSADSYPSLSLPANHADVEELLERIKTRLGFTLHVEKSSIDHPEAGKGLFLDGKADAGTVVCLYPGTAYRPQHIKFMKNYPRIDVENPYLLWRYDGVVLDGIAYKDDIPWQLRNPLATGHIINHVPPNSQPNVLQFMVDYDLSTIPQDLHPLIPNLTFDPEKHFTVSSADKRRVSRITTSILGRTVGSLVDMVVRERAGGSQLFTLSSRTVQKGLVLVALRDLEDEELFFNYRFNTDGPDWYVDPDPAQSRRRWASSAFWE